MVPSPPRRYRDRIPVHLLEKEADIETYEHAIADAETLPPDSDTDEEEEVVAIEVEEKKEEPDVRTLYGRPLSDYVGRVVELEKGVYATGTPPAFEGANRDQWYNTEISALDLIEDEEEEEEKK